MKVPTPVILEENAHATERARKLSPPVILEENALAAELASIRNALVHYQVFTLILYTHVKLYP